MKNEKAVSAVIGVILMVVVTVIIAAILAVFVFGIGAPTKAPQAKLKYTAITNLSSGDFDFKVTHGGGDPIILKDEQLLVKDAVSDTVGSIAINGFSTNGTTMDYYFPGKTTLAPGFTIISNLTNVMKGDILVVQVMDAPTGQMVSETKITVQ